MTTQCSEWIHNSYTLPLFSWVTQTWFIFRLISCYSMNGIRMLVHLWVPSLITTSFHLSLRSWCFCRKLHRAISFSRFPSAASSVVLQNAPEMFYRLRNIPRLPISMEAEWIQIYIHTFWVNSSLTIHTAIMLICEHLACQRSEHVGVFLKSCLSGLPFELTVETEKQIRMRSHAAASSICLFRWVKRVSRNILKLHKLSLSLDSLRAEDDSDVCERCLMTFTSLTFNILIDKMF